MKEGDPLGTKREREMVVEQCGEGRRPAGDQERHGGGVMRLRKETRWGSRETWWRSNEVKEGDQLGIKIDTVVEQCVEGRRPAGDQERHGGGAMG